MSNIVPYNDIERMGTAIAKSGLFGVKTPEQAIALMLIAQAEGLHPAIAARDYHVIQGRPALKADAMLARFLQNGGKVQWHELSDKVVSATFSHPAGGDARITWSFADAEKIGLTSKDNWRNYPRAMLRSRVVSEGVRTVYPNAVVGVYTPEEVSDFTPETKTSIEAPVIDVEPEGTEWPVMIPGNDTPYQSCGFAAEWVDTINDLVERITSSPKYTPAERSDKLKLLAKANAAVFEKLPEDMKPEVKMEFN